MVPSMSMAGSPQRHILAAGDQPGVCGPPGPLGVAEQAPRALQWGRASALFGDQLYLSLIDMSGAPSSLTTRGRGHGSLGQICLLSFSPLSRRGRTLCILRRLDRAERRLGHAFAAEPGALLGPDRRSRARRRRESAAPWQRGMPCRGGAATGEWLPCSSSSARHFGPYLYFGPN